MMSNKEHYIQLCSQSKQIPVFAQPWWLDAICKQWDVAISRKGDLITGTWAYPMEQKLGVAMIRTPMLTPYLGPQVYFPTDLKERNKDGFEYDTIADLIKQLPDAPVWNLSIQPGIKQAGLFRQNGLESRVQQTFLTDLHVDEQTLLANMKDTAKRNIRAAEADVTMLNAPEYLKELYQFQKNTLEQKGKTLNYSLADLQRIMNAALANNSCALWVAKDASGTIQAIVWQVWDNERSYYFMGGQNPEGNSYRAMTLLLWQAMKHAKQLGHKYFDLEGSMDEGVERFFRNFGGSRELYILLIKNTSLVWQLKQAVVQK
jgi:lipid II:glycine glycyltransferase (peptidoglycan interpeptide bridge formation enzyme)